MEPIVKIRAEILQHDPNSCRFTVDRVLFRGFIRFGTSERAKGSALPERLFALPRVAAVMIQGQEITIKQAPPVDWRASGAGIGAAIRAHIQSGEAPISEEAVKSAPDEDKLREKIQTILDEQINPGIASHGGTISLLDVRGNKVYIQMGGGCQGCSSASATLRSGVETTLREQIPEIGEIFDTTDHASGTNPYYSAAHV